MNFDQNPATNKNRNLERTSETAKIRSWVQFYTPRSIQLAQIAKCLMRSSIKFEKVEEKFELIQPEGQLLLQLLSDRSIVFDNISIPSTMLNFNCVAYDPSKLETSLELYDIFVRSHKCFVLRCSRFYFNLIFNMILVYFTEFSVIMCKIFSVILCIFCNLAYFQLSN